MVSSCRKLVSEINQGSIYRRRELKYRTKVKCDDFELLLIQNGYKTLAKNIPEFHKKRKLGFYVERISNANSDLLSVLTTNKAVYHHNCFLKYSDSKLKRFNDPSKKRKSTEDEN